jgi:hypothetical protein
VLSGGVVKGGSAGIWKFERSPGAEADGLSQASFEDKANCWEKVVVAEVCLLSSLNDPGGI